MPRWRQLREKPDYKYLCLGHTLVEVLEAAIETQRYGRDPPWFSDEVNRDLIAYFMGRERLTPADAIALMEPMREARDWSAAFAADYVGTRIGWGMHLNLLAEVTAPDGGRAWTMPDREPHFDMHKGRTRRIRGLPPIEQIAMDRRRARAAKLNATLDTKHARKIAPTVAQALAQMTEAEPDLAMPERWSSYVGADIMVRWPTVAEARCLLVDLHHGMDRKRQREWLRHLVAEADAAIFRASRREGERQAAAAALLAEDAGAFEGL